MESAAQLEPSIIHLKNPLEPDTDLTLETELTRIQIDLLDSEKQLQNSNVELGQTLSKMSNLEAQLFDTKDQLDAAHLQITEFQEKEE